jgi:hypothetical protein
MALERGFDATFGPPAKLPPQPFTLGSLYWPLWGLYHGFRHQMLSHVPQELLPRPIFNLPLYGLPEGKLEKPMIQERLSQFD